MDIQLPQILFQLVNFSVVLGALVYLLYKPVQKILDERAEKVAESQAEVDKIATEKEQIEALKTKTKRAAEKEAAQILEEANKEAIKKKQKLVAEAKSSLQAELKKAQENWQAERKQLLADSQKQMVEAVVEVSGMVLGKKLNKTADQKLIGKGLDEALKQM